MKILKFIVLPILISLNSCFFIFDSGYKGLATTTLAGFTVISETGCFMSTTKPEVEGDDQILNTVINLVTMGDKYITACVVATNYVNMKEELWFDPDQLFINFYASSDVAIPGDGTVGSGSEVLIYGNKLNNQYTSSFYFSGLTTNGNGLCSTFLGDTSIAGKFMADLDMVNLHKKPYIVARIPFCGNQALGTASNPLYSEKHYIKLPDKTNN